MISPSFTALSLVNLPRREDCVYQPIVTWNAASPAGATINAVLHELLKDQLDSKASIDVLVMTSL